AEAGAYTSFSKGRTRPDSRIGPGLRRGDELGGTRLHPARLHPLGLQPVRRSAVDARVKDTADSKSGAGMGRA
ncbi:hypothetical protein, partial [Sphingomonas sp.]|uniref:hypothetical protein n=1 Tax=Sphingomonas sp. TaxID=28214 RepID=UPI0025EC4DF6